ncbi:MAG: chemotaxis response regulator protein-glutamate methylesterase [Sporolactobacillus sp.]
MQKIRVMVVDDSAFMRQTIKAMIEEDSLFQVVATARNGQDALKKLQLYKPDAVTLDIVMDGEMDGLDVLHSIMTLRPTPTIMVSGASDENVNYVIEAISNGAFDFIFKPSGKIGDIERIERELQQKLRQAVSRKKKTSDDEQTPAPERHAEAVRSPLKSTPSAARKQSAPSVSRPSAVRFARTEKTIVFVGTSTGGPKALQTLVPSFRSDFPAPIVIVQHMPPRFTRSLADRLNHLSALVVSEACEGDVLQNGHVYVAPGGHHLQVSERADGRLIVHLTDTPPVHGVKPAVDVTLQSFLATRSYAFAVAILTGMGRDGADGLTALKASGKKVYAIAEAEESCVVYGMPRAAVDTGLIDEITPLQRVCDAMTRRFDIL